MLSQPASMALVFDFFLTTIGLAGVFLHSSGDHHGIVGCFSLLTLADRAIIRATCHKED
jgi:hypothetical protein